MTGVCLFVCVVGPGIDSMSPDFVRSRASQAAGSDGRLAQKKRNRVPISGDRDCVDTICADVCSIPTPCRLFLFGTLQRIHHHHHHHHINELYNCFYIPVCSIRLWVSRMVRSRVLNSTLGFSYGTIPSALLYFGFVLWYGLVYSVIP